MSKRVFSLNKASIKGKGIIFDMDGVLFDTEKDSLVLLHELGLEMGMDIPRDFIIKNMGRNQNDLNIIYKEKFGEKFKPEPFWKEYWKRRNNKYDANGQPIKEGAIKLLKLAKEANIPCVVSSSSLREMVWIALKRSHVHEYFKDVVGGDMIEHSKPNPEIFLIGARLLGIRPEECIVIEDSLNGLKAARAGNMISCFVKDIPDYPDDILIQYADFQFDSAEEIAEFF